MYIFELWKFKCILCEYERICVVKENCTLSIYNITESF